jgi:hypothetical protein
MFAKVLFSTVSKAFRKSINEQHNFLPSEKYNEIEFLKSLEGIPPVEIKEKCMSKITRFVELFILMYADDTVLLAVSHYIS